MSSVLARLSVLIAIALLPALGFQIYSEITARQVRQKLIQTEALRLLRTVTSEQHRIIEGAQQVLDVLAASPAVQDHVPATCQRLLVNLLRQTHRYSNASVIGLNGKVTCSPIPLDPSINVSDRSYFQTALRTGGLAVGEYVVGRGSGKPTVQIGEPFRNQDGNISGVVQVSLNLQWLAQQIDQLDLPPDSIVSIVDRNGIFLARRPGGMRYVGQPVPAEHRLRLNGTAERIYQSIGRIDHGRSVMLAMSPPGASPMGLEINVALDERTTFGAVAAADRTGLLLILAGAALALLLTLSLGSRLIRRPVNRLLAVGEHWRRGDLTARTGLPRDSSEFGRLTAVLEDMAGAVQARERALNAALESTTDYVLLAGRDWRITFINARLHQRAGTLSVGQDFREVLHGLLGEPLGAACHTAMDTGVAQTLELRLDRLGADVEVSVFPSAEGLSLFARDVTVERRATTDLRESENRLQLAREAAGFGIWDCDFLNNTLVWSDQQWRLHGLEPAADPADPAMWRHCLHPDDRERMAALREAPPADPEHALNTEYRVVWPDRSVHWLQTRTTISRTTGGALARIVGLTLDVTVAHETEAALRRLSTDLEARVEQEIAARDAAQVRAAQAERVQALGQLAGGIAHDMNNVLHAVGGALRLIQRRSVDTAAVGRFAQIGIDAVERGASVSRRLLTVGRHSDLRSERLDLAAVFASLREILTYTLGGGIDVQVLPFGELPPVLADKGQLETVLINLATNGRDAMANGGRLTFSCSPDRIDKASAVDDATLAAGDYVRLICVDTGCGMDAATLARAREPFFSTKASGAGTGLGLAMAQGFAEQSGGALGVVSRPGEGTTVTLWLPQAPTGAPAESAHPGSACCSGRASGTHPARVLFVDDELMIRTLMTEHLVDAGYEVLSASSGQEALVLLNRNDKLDILVTDLAMPGMDGLALIRAVHDRRPGVPAILLTGYAGDPTVLALHGIGSGSDGAFRRGAVSLMHKPVTQQQLLDRIGTLLVRRPDAPITGSAASTA